MIHSTVRWSFRSCACPLLKRISVTRAVNLFFGSKEKNPKVRLLLAIEKLHAEPTNELYKRLVHVARAAVHHDFAADPEHWPRPVQMIVALHYFDPAFRSNDDGQSKAIRRGEIESFCTQMFKDAIFDSIARSPQYCGVLLDKAGTNLYVLLRSAKSFRFLDDWRYLGYTRHPKAALFYSKVSAK